MTTLPSPSSVQETPWWTAMRDCFQDPRHHPEGDVATHTKMVYDALVGTSDFKGLPHERQYVLAWAALLHDVGKPATTRVIDGRLSAPAHSRRGAILARRILWQAGERPEIREDVCNLVKAHMRPGFLFERDDIEREMVLLSQLLQIQELTMLAWADTRGRGTPLRPRVTSRLELFEEYARELTVWDRPWPFPNAETRFQYARTPGRALRYDAYDDRWGEVVLLSGLPASGKDTWARRQGLPVVALDDIRDEWGYPRDRTDGRLIQEAQARAKRHLRAHEPFVWNTTGLTERDRARTIRLFDAYRARVRIVTLEVSADLHPQRNQGRTHPVPHDVLDRMLDRWDAPTVLECHHLDAVDT